MKNNRSNMNNKSPMDEREQKVIGDVSTTIVLITIMYLLVEIIYKYVTTRDILTTSWEIGLILTIGITFVVGMSLKREINLPKNFLGVKLPTSNSKGDKKTRLKSYFLGSLAFSIAITVITLFFTFIGVDERLKTIIYIGEFVGLIVMLFALNYIIGEYKIRKYNKYMKTLDN